MKRINNKTFGRLLSSKGGIEKLNLRRYASITEKITINKSINSINQRGVCILENDTF
jgi:hypothetical protein